MAEGHIEADDQHEDHNADDGVAHPSTPGSSDKNGGLSLPWARVKKLIRAEDDVKAVSNEATFVIGRAAEMVLVDLMVPKAHASMLRDARKAFLYKDVANAVQAEEALDILADIVPQKVSVAQLMQQQQEEQQRA